MILAFHKPYGVLSQFTQEAAGQHTLAEFDFPADVYPIGRLDSDSEGLLLLSNEREITDRLLNPRYGHERTYWVQVEGIPTEEALQALRKGGLNIKGHFTAPCSVRLLDTAPCQKERVPPIRQRAHIPTSWIELRLTEGKNRQVRRMTAAVGFPTLRLIRAAIGKYELLNLVEGTWRELDREERESLFSGNRFPDSGKTPPPQERRAPSRYPRTSSSRYGRGRRTDS